MAIYHCSIKIIGRSDGKSAVASSAYRSCEKLMDDRTGLIHDFTKKRGVVFKEVSLALCIVSVTLALIAVKYIPMDINVLRHKKTHTGRCKSACMSIIKQGFS